MTARRAPSAWPRGRAPMHDREALTRAGLVAQVLSTVLMDSAGRRPLLLTSIAGMCASATALTLSLGLPEPVWASRLAIGSLVGFVSAYGLGLGPVTYLLPAEIFPAAYRSAGSGLAMSTLWLANFCSAQAFLPQASLLNQRAFMPHVAILAVALLFAAAVVPETRGKSLEQIEREMNDT